MALAFFVGLAATHHHIKQLKNKKAIVVMASGGLPVDSPADFATPYIRQVLNFIGIEDIFHIDASGSKREPGQVIAHGKQQVDQLMAEASAEQPEETA